ncbi:MAG TPA: type II and III secretion system protein family protein [Sphingomicrobium sp.]|jgi:pilus assembly protein CpaC|nr:type II and III secretion system protein family protein [Sphingomicrobium sp.]
MTTRKYRIGTAFAALALGLASVGSAGPAAAQAAGSYKPSSQMLLSVGEGQMINLSRPVADVWTSNDKVADVHVTSARQLNIFGKEAGEATVIATAANGSVVYATNVRVSQNISSVNQMMRAAMPDSNIQVTTVGQMAVLNGTVASPADSAQAEALVRSLLNPGVDTSSPTALLKMVPVNRLKVATPLQVNLRVRVAEVNRTLLKQIGVNLLTETSGGFSIGLAKGQGISLPPVTCTSSCAPPKVIRSPIGSTISGIGSLFGLDIISSLDLAETDGFVTTLAEPNLTALSGETASFLAGGEYPVPVSQSLGTSTIEWKQYGVGLAFTPVVLADGRISMRVRPEVSELSTEGSIKVGDVIVPALTVRRAETTVELGSGQSFMIAGLLRNGSTNNIDKAPFLGDIPILGSLFRSTKFQRQETELVIVITPYLVKPVSNQIALPTDGLRAPTDSQRVWEGQSFVGQKGAQPAQSAPAPAIGVQGAAVAPGFKL